MYEVVDAYDITMAKTFINYASTILIMLNQHEKIIN